MIKANEIRVGNWLNDPRQYDPMFFPKTENGYFRATARDIQFAEEFEPIPLTEEILLKCGFIKTGEEYSQSDDEMMPVYKLGFFSIVLRDNEFRLWIEIEDDAFYSFSWTKIQYLHQLQNIYFALTGQELEINL